MDRLDLEEILKAEDATFAAVAGLLEAAEGAAVAVRAAVDVHHGAKAGRDALGAFRVAGLEIGDKAVGRIVAIAMASSSVSKGMIERTEPNTSSRAMRMSLLTSAKIVGLTK